MKRRVAWIRAKLHFKRIRSRFLAAMILLSVPPLALVGAISYNIAKDTLLETNTQTTQDHLGTSSEVADLIFKNVINLNRSVVLNESIREDLKASPYATEEERVDIKERTVLQLQKMINNNFLDYRYVDSICVYDLNYSAYCLGRSDDTGIYTGNTAGEIEAMPWYQAAFKRQGGILFHPVNVLGDSSNTFSTIRLYRDSESINGERIGLLIVNISKTIFETVFTASSSYGGEFLAVDSSAGPSQVVYPADSRIKPYLVDSNLESAYRSLQKEGYLSVNIRNETTGWIFIHVIAVKDLLKESTKIGWATAIIASFIALVAIVMSYIISGSITHPLLRLKKMMLKWTGGARDFNEEFQDDEVGVIGESFKRMASDNQELNEKLLHAELKEKDAELRVLQAQIKPHFLYNTLDSIYWMAALQKNHEVAQMAVSLSESFKLSLNKGKEQIPLYKELKHIQHYMTIQNIRYNNRFNYVEDIEESMMGIEVLKLILQPLVENAIYHGLEPKVGRGTIQVTGTRAGEYLQFSITDDGVGITDMARTEQGYGLRNVRERLQLYYGDTSVFRITSEPDQGTTVELIFKITPEEAYAHA